jgi:hypothetical protein
LIELLEDAPRRDVQEAVDVTLFLHGEWVEYKPAWGRSEIRGSEIRD